MTRPGIEPRSPGPLANTLTAGPFHQHYIQVNFWSYPTILKLGYNCRSQKWARVLSCNTLNTVLYLSCLPVFLLKFFLFSFSDSTVFLCFYISFSSYIYFRLLLKCILFFCLFFSHFSFVFSFFSLFVSNSFSFFVFTFFPFSSSGLCSLSSFLLFSTSLCSLFEWGS